MKKKTEKIRNGNFDYEAPRLILSQEEIQVRIKPGTKMQQELYLGTENDVKISGYVNSSDRRLMPSVEYFSGVSVSFVYGVDAVGMENGDICRGILYLITDVGEYEIPFTIEAAEETIAISGGQVDSLQAFAALAESNRREAFRLFKNPVMLSLLKEERLKTMYLGMARNPITYQHVEEFLIAAGQKEPVDVTLKEEEHVYYEIRESMKESLILVRSGWGYLRLEVEARGDFIQLEKQVLTEEDFIGSLCRLEFVLLHSKIGTGKKFGSIVIRSPYKTLEYRITVSRNSGLTVNMNIFEKRCLAELYTDFMDLQLQRITEAKWLERAQTILQKLSEAGCDYPIYQVYLAYVYHKDGQQDKAREILLKYQNMSFTRQDIELAGAYLYVSYQAELLADRWDVTDKLQKLYRRQESSYLLLWLLMQIDEEYMGSPLRAGAALARQFDLGCRSPLLYLEAFRLVEKEMSLLNRMSPFWVQVMRFAGEKGMLTEELCMRIAYLSRYENLFSQSLYEVLVMAYEQYPSDDTLTAICKLIMKDRPGRKRYFRWFSKAVERNLRLTRLFESYMESIDNRYQEILPKQIRRYFIYNNELSDGKKAFIYANIIRHRKEDEEIFARYQSIIHQFAAQKLAEGAMSEDYAVLYQELSEHIESEEEARALEKVAFTSRLYCDDPKIRNVIVRHGQLNREEMYPCKKGVAYPRLYTKDAVILFQDSQQRRYAATVAYNLQSLFDETFVSRCKSYGIPSTGMLLHECCDERAQNAITADNLELYQRLADCEEFSEEYRQMVRRRLLSYYQENAREEAVEEYLRKIDLRVFAKIGKKQLMELLIEHGMQQEAYEVLREFGAEEVDVRALLKLCNRMILDSVFEEDEELLWLAHDVFEHGIYTDVVLKYLMLFYIGPLDEMMELWHACVKFQMDSLHLEERILKQLIFVEDYRTEGAEILKHYIKQKGKNELVMSYLTMISYGYFVHGRQVQPYIYLILKESFEKDRSMDRICRLALLKIHSERRTQDAVWERQVRRLLKECTAEGLFFAFFRKFPAELRAACQMDDKVFVEYRGNPEAKVVLYYALDTGLGNELEYRSEPLRNRYHGYFNKSFTLFYGETLHYYFQVTNGNSVRNTSKKILAASAESGREKSRYQMINQILAARKLGKNDTVKEKLQQYRLQEKYVEQLFSIEKEESHE